MAPTRPELALRLRRLRESHWPGRPVTQPELAGALGMATSSVSSWENRRDPKVPPLHRLRAIATFFATPRSLDGGSPRLLPDADLTADERTGRDQLLQELTALLSDTSVDTAADAATVDFWQFPDGAPVRIVAGPLDRDARPAHATGSHRNYMAFSAYSDQDSVVELVGHIRAQNPGSDVKFRLVNRLENADMRSHLVIVGEPASAHIPINSFTGDRIPVRQRAAALPDGKTFEVTERDGTHRVHAPLFRSHDQALIQDVGYLMRLRTSPYNTARSLTLCSGVYTRGTYGAVRSTTDSQHRAANQRHLAEAFGGDDCFGVLLRVPTYEHVTGTPVLPDDVLHRFRLDL